MQHDLESEVSTISPQSLYKAQGALLVKSEETPSSQLTDVISVEQGLRGRKKPSSTVWRLILMLGDMSLFIVLFGSLVFFHLVPQASTNTLEIQEVTLIWICLALVSWGLAVNMTQSQNLNDASNRFKGPMLYMVCACTYVYLLDIPVIFPARCWVRKFS